MTTVRVILSHHNRPARAPDGSDLPDWRLHQRLVVLADTAAAGDGHHRAVPLWLRVYGSKELLSRVGRPAADTEVSSGLLETAVRLLRTAGTAVSAVDIEPVGGDVRELRWDTVTARVGLSTAGGSRPPVTVPAKYGLALAAVAGAPVRVPDAVMDRLAVPVADEDVLAPFLPPAYAWPPVGPPRRFEPRNMAFAGGLDHWELAGGFSRDSQQAGQDYSCTVSRTSAGQSAILASTVQEPVGSAALVQAIYADDYRGTAVTFRGQVRTVGVVGQAGLHLAVGGPADDQTRSSQAAPGSSDWTWHEVTVPVPVAATAIRFGVCLAGHGRVELRGAELATAPWGTGE